jgi:hypothetical protein
MVLRQKKLDKGAKIEREEEEEAYEPQYVTPLISIKSGSPILKRL